MFHLKWSASLAVGHNGRMTVLAVTRLRPLEVESPDRLERPDRRPLSQGQVLNNPCKFYAMFNGLSQRVAKASKTVSLTRLIG